MNHTNLANHIKNCIVLFICLCFSQVGKADEVSMTNYEAENLSLKNFVVVANEGAFNDSIITLDKDYGTAIRTSNFTGNYDLYLTYLVEGEGKCVFEIYIDDKLVDSWLANQYGGVYTNDPLNRVFHVSQNVALEKSSRIEIVGYISEGEHCNIDRLGIAETTIDDSQSKLTWSSDGSLSSLILKGSEYLNTATSSGFELVVSEGVKLRTSSADRLEADEQNVQLINESSYSQRSYTFRTERYEHHIKLRLLNMEGIPKRDRSLGLRLEIPYTSDLDFVVLDDQIEVEEKSNTLTVFWTNLATRHIIPGGYLAIYAESDKVAAFNEINSLDEIVIPPPPVAPSNISLSKYRFTENNAIGDSISFLSADDPQGDIASYTLISGEGDDDNNKFIIEEDVLKANTVFDYEAGALVYIRVQVSDSASNTFEKPFILALVDDDSDTGFKNGSKLQGFNIYPNPTNSKLYIAGQKDCFIEIINVQGEKVFSTWHSGIETTIDMEPYNNGLYLIKLSTSDGVIVKKVVSQD